MAKFLDSDGVLYFWGKVKAYVQQQIQAVGALTGVKGDAESTYRTGNVNLTPANIGVGAIGLLDSLSASDIPSLDYTTVDSSTALVDAGNNAKTITAQYSGNAVAATAYVTMWGNYKLVAVTIANLWSKLVSTGIKLKDATINRDAANPTSAQWSGKEITFQDVDGERIAFVNVKRNTNGSIELCVSAENESTSGGDLYNSLNMAIARDGTKSYSVSDAAAFRTAIGVGTIGTKNSLAASDIPSLAASKITSGTLGIARGGTGSSSVTSKLNNTNATIYIWGKLVMVQLHGQTKTPDGTAIWSTAYLADYKPGYNVSAIVAATTGELARVWVGASDGKIYLSAVNTSTSKAWYGTLVYMLA